MPSARSQTLLRASKALAVASGLLLIFIGTTAKADNITVTEQTDYWFEFTEPTLFDVRTYAVEGYGSDPMLWLYNSEGTLIAANDDWYGLQSNITISLQPGWYRLRASVCCGNPDAWWEGVVYELSSSAIPGTTSSTVETWLSTTTSTTTLPIRTEPSTTTTETSLPSSESSVESSTTSLMPSSSSEVSTTSQTTTSLAIPTTTKTTSPAATSSGSTSSAPTTGVPGTSPILPQETTTTTQAPKQPDAQDRPSEVIVEALAGSQDPEVVREAIQEIAASLETLTGEELNQIVEVINQAPVEVKKQFEQEVNIFTAGLDNYVPADSNVTVGQRRALVAIGAVLTAAPILTMRRN